MKAPLDGAPLRTPSARMCLGDIALLSITGVLILGSMLMVAFLIVMARPATAAPASPVSLSLTVSKEKRETASDGTTAVTLVPADTIVPGDRLVYVLTYANTGKEPASNLVVDYPLPEGVSYRAAAEGSQRPLVSADGVHFAPSVSPASVKALRWQVPAAVAPGGKGQVSFTATLD